MRKLLVAVPFVMLSACGHEAGSEGDPPPADSLSQVAQAIDLSNYDLPLQVILPNAQASGGAKAVVGWNEEEGWFGVKVGEHFSLHITEGPGDLPRLKRDLENDLVRKHALLIDKPDLVVYRSEFPDDPTLVQLHFYQVIMAGDRSFVVESDPEGRFDQTDVERMSEAVFPIVPG